MNRNPRHKRIKKIIPDRRPHEGSPLSSNLTCSVSLLFVNSSLVVERGIWLVCCLLFSSRSRSFNRDLSCFESCLSIEMTREERGREGWFGFFLKAISETIATPVVIEKFRLLIANRCLATYIHQHLFAALSLHRDVPLFRQVIFFASRIGNIFSVPIFWFSRTMV